MKQFTFTTNDFCKYKATGILVNGRRFPAKFSDNFYYIDGINLYRGHVYGKSIKTGKWVMLKEVFN
jgi:hypothetical protein